MISFLSFYIFALVLVNRAVILSIPSFWPSIAAHPLVNILCGVFSDLMVGLSFFLLIEIFQHLRSRFSPLPRYASNVFVVACFLILNLIFAIHVRYIEYFGMTVRIHHLLMLDSGDSLTAGSTMVFTSWRVWVVLLLPMMIASIFKRISDLRRPGFFSTTRIPAYVVYALTLVLIVAFNSGTLIARGRPGMNYELRYNPLSALYYNAREYREFSFQKLPSVDALMQLRQLKGIADPQRAWTQPGPSDGDFYPLLQSKILSHEQNSKLGETRQKIRDFLAAGERARGPWNIVFMIQESLRAKEFDIFGNRDENFAGITPRMNETFAKGIRFQETLAVVHATSHGQIASQCGIFAFVNSPLMYVLPSLNFTCLTDLLSERGYETYFFYGSDNGFDNQGDFYRTHHVDHIFGSEVYEEEMPRGGWGFSDKVLTDFAITQLRKAKQPFYATVLTLSNHSPKVLPEDAPAFIDRKVPLEAQLLAYTDWVWGAFYDALSAAAPHTIFVLIGDHGVGFKSDTRFREQSWDLFRNNHRIPWVIMIPGLPRALAIDVPHLVSNADVPATLLSLLGQTNVQQSFLGEDAFTRRAPVFHNHKDRLYTVAWNDGNPLVEPLSEQAALALTALANYNLIAPPRENP